MNRLFNTSVGLPNCRVIQHCLHGRSEVSDSGDFEFKIMNHFVLVSQKFICLEFFCIFFWD